MMSKLGKWVKKTFKKVVEVVKKVIVPIAIIAAVVWTAGAALGAFASAGTLGGSAIFGASAGAGAFGGGGAALSGLWTTVTGAVAGATAKIKGALGMQGAGAGAAGGVTPGVAGADFGIMGVPSTAGGMSGAGGGAAAAGMTGFEKAALTSTVIGGLTEPTAEDIANAQAKSRGFRGSFYGAEAGGTAPQESPRLRVPGLQQQPITPAPQAATNLFPTLGQNQPTPTFGQFSRQQPMDLFAYA